jgi:uncharacterized hydrophobic protein (TIGR00271 family)
VKAWLTRLGIVIHGGPTYAEDLAELEGKLYFDREASRDPYVRFATLLVLSIIIASGGVLSDSTATVIGAMIVAPLMTPIMAAALAIVAGDMRSVGRSLALVAAGALTAVVLSFVIGVLVPGSLDIASNSQITGRISPRGLDLLVALASGAAGAFALSRRAVSDALPGVAIAISLVPPLCVVGITLSAGDVDAASGALLLFVTNFLAILAAGGGLLALMGYGAVARRNVDASGRTRAAVVTSAAVVIVAIPLFISGYGAALDSQLEATAKQDAAAWVSGSSYELLSVAVSGDTVTITVDGSGPLPSTATLVSQISAARPSASIVLRARSGQRDGLKQP